MKNKNTCPTCEKSTCEKKKIDRFQINRSDLT